MRKLIISLLGVFASAFMFAQEADTLAASTPYGLKKPDKEPALVAEPDNGSAIGKGDIIKTGLSFGPLPIVAFDQDRGFEYGALLNIFNFGDGSSYPTPLSTWYFEAARYTKGSEQYIVAYDNRVLIPGVRISAAAQVTNEKALDFYGFNGYESIYDATAPTSFYRIRRTVPYFKVDFTGNLGKVKNLYWKAGYHFHYFKMGESSANAASSFTPSSLFQVYRQLGIIPGEDAEGGFSSALRLGLMYDTRDFEAAPSRGIWAEGHVAFAPEFLGTSKGYTKFNLTFRQYLPLYHDRLVFAYRLNFQGFIGSAPAFYILPYDTIMGPMYDRDGFGGYRTVRGLMRSRVQGINTGYFNTELRWKFVDFKVFKQNITLGLSGFFDGARVFKGVDLMNHSTSFLPIDLNTKDYFNFSQDGKLNDSFHLSAGGGFRFIMNQNFIIAVEYGKAFDKQDNSKGALYINTGYLF